LPSFTLTANQGDAVQQALRPYATAGVALVGAGLIVINPMAPRLPDTFTVQEIKLVSGEDTLPDIAAPWIDVFNTASENSTTLLNTFYEAPLIGLQQSIANQSGYLQDFFNDPTSSTVASINGEIQNNLAAVLTGFTLQNTTSQTLNTVTEHTLSSESAGLFHELPQFLPSDINPAEVTPIVDFLASPDSGIIMGDLGPLISPLVELFNCIAAGDDLNTTLADVTGAFFNGATLNLDNLIPLIYQADVFPPGLNIANLDIAFGGLLTPGDTASGVGGSIFNSLGIDLTSVPILGSLDVPSNAVGPLGAWEGWAQTIADLLGWDGSGSPLSDLTLPTIPTDFLDGGTAAASAGADLSTAAGDLSTLVQDLVSAF
jgi:hypothetical protein